MNHDLSPAVIAAVKAALAELGDAASQLSWFFGNSAEFSKPMAVIPARELVPEAA